MGSGRVEFLCTSRKSLGAKKAIFASLALMAVSLFAQQFLLVDNASARNYSECVAGANDKIKVNLNSDGQAYPYSSISEVASGSGEYGVKWACSLSNNSSAGAVVWLAGGPGYDDYDSWRTRVYVNSIMNRSGVQTMHVVGSVNNLSSPPNYATQVRLCADSGASSRCWENVGITRVSNWYYSDSRNWYFKRADDSSPLNWWTDPLKATIKIDMDKYMSSNPNIDSSNPNYDMVYLYMHRKFGDGGSTGITPMKFLIKKASAATFTGSVTATAIDSNNNNSVSSTTNNPGANQTITVSGDSYTIKFKHVIERTDSGGQPITNDWSTSINPTSRPASVNALGSASSGSVSTTTKTTYAVREYTYSGKINPGQTITYCETLTYNSKKGEGETTENGTKTSCVIVRREPEATFTGSITATITNDSTGASVTSTTSSPGDGQTITVGSGTYTVHFVHNINRTDSLGHSESNSWSTTVTPSSKPNAINALGTGTSGSQATTTKKAYKVRDYTYSGKLFAGQTITYCETLNFDTFKAVGKTTQRGSTTVCVKVKRASDVCASLKGNLTGTIYSRDKGYNYGQIGVKNRNLNDSYLYYGSYNTSGAVSIYARPGDEIKFEHNMCAGGVYARATGAKETVNSSFRYSGTSDSTDDNGVKSRYLFGEQVSAWDSSTQTSSPKNMVYTNVNESNILSQTLGNTSVSPGENNYYNNCVTGGSTTITNGYYKIAGGTNAYTCSNRVKTLDVGHTITQSLTWTNLGYDNGVKSGGNDVSATASVIVPYNYTLAPYVESGGSNHVVYLGESITMTPGVVVKSRRNTAIGSTPYATITKPTQASVKYYYKSASGAIIAEFDVPASSKTDFRFNQNGLIGGNGDSASASNNVDNGGTRLNKVTFAVPDDGTLNIGDKICVEINAYPADSHDSNIGDVVGAGVGDIALKEWSEASSGVSAVSCSTIAKKPTVSVESSNVYSATSLKASNYAKTQGSQNNRYGSWSEYGVFGRVTSGKIFASGAALGYSRAGYPQTKNANIVRENNSANSVATTANSDECTFMTQTFANANCQTSSSSIGGVTAGQYEQRVKDHYMTSGGTFDVSGLSAKKYEGVNYYDVSGYNGSDVITTPSGLVRFDSKNNLYISALPNLSNEQFASKGVEKRNNTIVYSAPGKNVVIDGDLGFDDNQKSSIDSLSQAIIFAKNVYITDRPTYINAIIVADEINTCKYVGGTKVAIGGKGSASTITANQCNQSLRFDSPVIVKKVILNRTGGADGGIASIVRAEIFNLNMANYLWSFSQMSRLSQAVTVYSRELSTRY